VPGFRTIILLVSIGLLTPDAPAAPLSGPVPLPDSGRRSKEKKSAEPEAPKPKQPKPVSNRSRSPWRRPR
jgi:hypothetical protein